MTRTLVARGPYISLACWAGFVATVLLMPFLEDGYSPIDEAISYGAIGEYGWLQVVGFLALATGTTLLAACLTTQTRGQQGVVALLALSVLGVVTLAVFPTDGHGEETTAVGSIHSAGAAVAFVATIAAMLWSSRTFARDDVVAKLVPLSLVLGAAAALLLIALTTGIGPTGLVQRATVACEVVWLSAVALQIRGQTTRTTLDFGTTGQAR